MWLASDHTHCKAFILALHRAPAGLQRLLSVWAEQLILQALDPLFFLVKVMEVACPPISLAVSQSLSGGEWQFNTSERPLSARSASSAVCAEARPGGQFPQRWRLVPVEVPWLPASPFLQSSQQLSHWRPEWGHLEDACGPC